MTLDEIQSALTNKTRVTTWPYITGIIVGVDMDLGGTLLAIPAQDLACKIKTDRGTTISVLIRDVTPL